MDDETFTISLSGEALRKLKERAAKEGTSITDYVKRAIGLRAFFQDELALPDVEVLLRDKRKGKVEVVDIRSPK